MQQEQEKVLSKMVCKNRNFFEDGIDDNKMGRCDTPIMMAHLLRGVEAKFDPKRK